MKNANKVQKKIFSNGTKDIMTHFNMSLAVTWRRDNNKQRKRFHAKCENDAEGCPYTLNFFQIEKFCQVVEG